MGGWESLAGGWGSLSTLDFLREMHEVIWWIGVVCQWIKFSPCWISGRKCMRQVDGWELLVSEWCSFSTLHFLKETYELSWCVGVTC